MYFYPLHTTQRIRCEQNKGPKQLCIPISPSFQFILSPIPHQHTDEMRANVKAPNVTGKMWFGQICGGQVKVQRESGTVLMCVWIGQCDWESDGKSLDLGYGNREQMLLRSSLVRQNQLATAAFGIEVKLLQRSPMLNQRWNTWMTQFFSPIRLHFMQWNSDSLKTFPTFWDAGQRYYQCKVFESKFQHFKYLLLNEIFQHQLACTLCSEI